MTDAVDVISGESRHCGSCIWKERFMKKIRVLIVEDSSMMRKVLTSILSSDHEIEVVGAANDPYEARDLIKKLNPDVLTLDIELPKMNGLKFLENLMRLRPMPVVMVSSLTQDGARSTMHALALGAVDFLAKPRGDMENGFRDVAPILINKVKAAAMVQVRTLVNRRKIPELGTVYAPGSSQPPSRFSTPGPVTPGSVAPSSRNGVVVEKMPPRVMETEVDRLIAIGASTGGTEAIQEVLVDMPADSPPIVIALHIPALFSRAFAERMNQITPLTVQEAMHDMPILPRNVYIAPGGQHLRIKRFGKKYFCALSQEERVNLHRPSVDVLFHSVADLCAENSVGVLLTGMGYDGAAGLKAMRDSGAPTIAQDEKTSVVFGMPRVAIEMGGASQVLSLHQIAGAVEKIWRAPVGSFA